MDRGMHNGLELEDHRRPNRVDENTRPPVNIEAEFGTLSGMVLDNSKIDDVLAFLQPDDFYRDTNQMVFRAIRGLWGGGKVVDGITLADELERRGEFHAIGGDDGLGRIIKSAPSAANTIFYAQIVKQKAISRTLLAVAERIRQDAYSANFTAEELLASAERALFEVADQNSGQKEYSVLADTIGGTVDRIFERQNGRRVEGVPSGWRELDDVTGGFKSGQLIYLAARTSMGKTALALNVIANVATESQIAVLVFSLEMEEEELKERLIATVAEVDGDKIQALNTMDDQDYYRVAMARDHLKQAAKIIIDDTPSRNVYQIASAARRAKAKHGVGLIVVDQIQLVEPENRRESRQLQIGVISRRLKILARELGVPILVLSQLNRGPEDREGHRPRLSDLRESGDQEQDADIVLLIHRDDYYDKDKNRGEAVLIVAKNRSGRRTDVEMGYVARIMKFIPRSQLTRFENPFAGVPAAQAY